MIFVSRASLLITIKFIGLCLLSVLVVNEIVPVFVNRCGEIGHLYGWVTVSPDGSPVSQECGELKLELSPNGVYDNRRNQRSNKFSVNEVGMRGVSPLEALPAGARKIFMLGGSQTFGVGLSSDTETMAAQLQNRLNNVVVYNAGVIGYASGQELIKLLTQIIDYKPDLVITVSGWNDAERSLRRGDRGYDLSFGDLEDLQRQLRLSTLIAYGGPMERFFAAAPRLFGSNLFTLFRKLSDRFTDNDREAERQRALLASRLYVRNVQKMDLVSRAAGSRLFVVLQPDSNTIHYKDFSPVSRCYDDFRRSVVEELKSKGILFLDANEPSIELPSEMFLDSVHMNVDGNIRLAKKMAEEVAISIPGFSLRN